MTSFSLFFQSYGIGFVAAAALGPIGLLLIQRTLKDGWRMGVASGLGIALADGLYGLSGALSLTALTALLVEYQFWIRLLGGGLLFYIGVKAILSVQITKNLPENDKVSASAGLAGAAGSIFLVTMTNPMTILFFSALYAGLAVGEFQPSDLGWAGYFGFGGGIFLGSLTWWLILSSLVAAARQRFQLQRLTWLNIASGLLIAGFGLWVWVQLFIG